jgi:tetratricopeptide (TPR) repeat protein
MKPVSHIALGGALAVAFAAAVSPAAAAPKQPQIQQVRSFALTKEERAAIFPLQTAMNANDYAAAAAALPTAQAGARSADAHYFVAQYQLRLGIGTGNSQMQSQAIDAMIASGGAPAADLAQLYGNQAALAAGTGDLRKAETAFTRLAEITPGDADTIAKLAEVKNDLGKIPESAALIARAIALREAAGQPVPEGWYKRALKIAYDAKIAPEAVKLSRALVVAYPSAENWRDAVIVHRDLGALDKDAALDLMRLKRAAKALHGERDYLELATALNDAGFPLEAKAVLDEGVAQRMVDPAKATFKELITLSGKRATAGKAALNGLQTKAMAAPTGALALGAGDAFYGAGDYAKAVDLYRAALQKGTVDPNVVNTRLGMALALAGRRAEAETAFRAVNGTRSDLASLWLAWLARRA